MTDERPTAARPLLTLCRAVIGGLFVFAAVMKLLPPGDVSVLGVTLKPIGPQTFYFSVLAFKILPDNVARFAAFAIPWTEGLAGALLILGLWTRAAAWVLSLALLAFIAGIVSVLQRRLSVSCGCFGSFKMFCGDVLGWCNVWQDVVMLALALPPAILGPGALALDNCLKGRRVDPPPAAT